jgi:alpha-D-glucose phosphate-specific phosphoglucomutase
MTMTTIKFGTDGWRDLMYDRFNLPNVKTVVRAIARYTLANQGAEQGIVVGYDARFFSDLFARETASLLGGYGIKVFLGERDYPTPVIAFAVKEYKAFGAIIFTASHNPPEYNGIKFVPEYAGPASPEITQAIETQIAIVQSASGEPEPVSLESLTATNRLARYEPTKAYLAKLHELVDVAAVRRAGLPMMIDPMYATGRGFLSALFEGCDIHEMHGERDPLFGGAMPDPQGKFLGELITAVKSRPGAIGLATDGDADRFGIIDSDGSYLTPNQVIPLLLFHLVKNRGFKGIAARTVATTHMIDKLGAWLGIETVETPVGFKYIGALMRQRPVIIGGEESGGLSIRGHIPEKDGILACALMAELRAVSGKPFSAILNELYEKVGHFHTRRLDLHLTEEFKKKLLERLENTPPATVGGLKVTEKRSIDGQKFLFENGSWLLARPSGTEPLVRIYFEAPSAPELGNLVIAVQQLITEWQGKA